VKRILVTGSRTWTDSPALMGAIMYELLYVDEPVTIVHGACPKGADVMADEFANLAQTHVERHPADWDQYGKSAGFVRNAEMVALGADVCLAFIKDESKGASMTADLAEKAGIRTVRYLASSSTEQCVTVGNDGLTDVQRADSAARWAAGQGAMPSREEMDRLRALTEAKRRA
jgi:hypothetical protein